MLSRKWVQRPLDALQDSLAASSLFFFISFVRRARPFRSRHPRKINMLDRENTTSAQLAIYRTTNAVQLAAPASHVRDTFSPAPNLLSQTHRIPEIPLLSHSLSFIYLFLSLFNQSLFLFLSSYLFLTKKMIQFVLRSKKKVEKMNEKMVGDQFHCQSRVKIMAALNFTLQFMKKYI